MKHLTLISAIVLLLSCSKAPEPVRPNAPTLSEDLVMAPAEADVIYVTLHSESQWRSSVQDSWCIAAPSMGGAGDISVGLYLVANTGDSARSTVVTFTNDGGSVSLRLTQQAPVRVPEQVFTHEDGAANSWAYDQLCRWYLYNDELRQSPPDDWDKPCGTFLSQLLLGLKTNVLDGGTYSNGSRYLYSSITRTQSSRAAGNFPLGYGFDFYLDYLSDYGYDLYARVRFLLPDSPAASSGLQRGDSIVAVNGVQISGFNYDRLIYDNVMNPRNGDQLRLTLSDGRTVSMTPAPVDDTPVVCHRIIEHEGHKTGYLMYNAFETGYLSGISHEYDDMMEAVLSDFSREGVGDMVLDLRYNTGGYLYSAQLMASLLAPQRCLGQLFCTLKYNDDIAASEGDKTMLLLPSAADKTLNLDKIYVLATDRTASASELVVNALRGVGVEVVHIGTRTEGKNVGMDGFVHTTAKYRYEMWPVTFISSNAAGFSAYENGFEPQYFCDEYMADKWYPLGDTREIMLSTALELIAGGQPQSATRAGAGAQNRRIEIQRPGRCGGMRGSLHQW